MRRSAILSALTIAALTSIASADTNVGTTKDGCDKSDLVSFTGKGGKPVSVKASSSGESDLDKPVRELTWFCGKSQEASSNDVPYDHVKLARKSNGAMTWTFIRISAPANPPAGTPVTTARTGDTADACDKKAVVSFTASHPVTVNASQTVVADFAKPLTEFSWLCGTSKERVANDAPFDEVRVSRSPNGAIRWVFSLRTAAPDPVTVCTKVHAFGRLVFKDENGKLQPLARAQVKLMDEDFGPTDQEMAHGLTDKNGAFDLTGNGGDSGCTGAGCKRPDPYVEFVLHEDHRVEVKDPIGNSPRVHTATHADTCGDINFHTQQWSGAELDAILYAHGQAAYQTFNDLIGPNERLPGNDGLVGIEYPTALIWNTPYTTWDTIHWQWHGDGKLDFSSFDHEFGHRIRHGADGDTTHFNWDATRFRYLRNHSMSDITNEGFAFNEGWAEYHKSLRHPTEVAKVWNGPSGINVEGEVATELLVLSNTCGGFPKLYATMKDAGANAFHSINEFRAEFMKRNPTCTDKGPHGGGPAPAPLAEKPAPLPPADSKLAAKIRGDLADRFKRRSAVRSPLRPTQLLAPAATDVIESLSDRQAARLETLRDAATSAYQKALDSLVLGPETVDSGAYAKAVAAAKAQLAKDLGAAMVSHAQATKQDIATVRAKADPQLAAYLDAITGTYARAEKAPPVELPKAFWPIAITLP
jgi:hypothetical protein